MGRIAQRVGQTVGLGIVLAFLAVAFTPLPNLVAGWLTVPSRIEEAEAIVVLGGGIEDSRTLSQTSLQRTIYGIRLYRYGLAPTIIFSGGEAGQEVAEGALMASLAVELGIPPAAIWTETRSTDTWTEAFEVARLTRHTGVRRILLVTDPLHMKRAGAAFERAGFEVLRAAGETAVPNVQKPEARLGLMRQVCQEALAQLYYWVWRRL